jgi:hypothetical protein
MKEPKNPMPTVQGQTIKSLLNLTACGLGIRIKKHSDRAFASNHEGLGVIVEEYDELIEAIRSNDNTKVLNEAIDLAVACLWLVASRIEKDQTPVCGCGHTHRCADAEGCECPGPVK